MNEGEGIVVALALLVIGAVMLVASITLGIQKLIERREHLQGGSPEAHQTQSQAIRQIRLVSGTKITFVMMLVGTAGAAFGGYLIKENVVARDHAYESQTRELIPRFMQA